MCIRDRQSNMNIDQSGANNSFSQWGMQAVTNAYQKTSNAISKAIKKNKVKLKYGGAIDKPCGESVRGLTQKHVAKRYMIAEKLLSLHHESYQQYKYV